MWLLLGGAMCALKQTAGDPGYKLYKGQQLVVPHGKRIIYTTSKVLPPLL